MPLKKRTLKKFAFLPTLVSRAEQTNVITHKVWLTTYYETQVLTFKKPKFFEWVTEARFLFTKENSDKET